MNGFSLEQVTDFGDFTRGKDLSDLLKQSYSNSCYQNCLQNVRISPDGKHMHVILHKPNIGLMTFDRCQKMLLIQSQKLDLYSTSNVPVVDLVYLNHSRTDGCSVVLAVVFENGRADFWKYSERKAGWHLLQASDLCNSPRAKVISVCTSAKFIIWCEERPPSESSSASRNKFRYCVCKRTYEVEEIGVCLGGVKVVLHNNPPYTVSVSGENVFLLPDVKENSLTSVSKFFLTWCLQQDTVTVSTSCTGTLLKKDLLASKEYDFKKLISDCIGTLSTVNPPEICAFSPTGCGGMLLLLSSGWISWLQTDGILRQVYKLADNCLASCGVHTSLNVYSDILALTVERTLYLIDTKCGMELEKIPLMNEGVLFVNCKERHVPHLLSETGLFSIKRSEADPSRILPGLPGRVRPGSVLVEAVFEEACKYYQQRSLSSAQLTVEKLKDGGMFQAPILLSSIVRDYLNGQKAIDSVQGTGSHGKLLSTLESELKGLVALEDIKASMVRASEKDLLGYCETLVREEVGRLLRSEVDKENVLYLNVIFSTFPCESWQATQRVLQLRFNGEGSLSAKAPPEVWKTILSPVHMAASSLLANGQPKLAPANVAVPVFELLCQSIFRFQPSWLPMFLELAQQQTSLSPSWSYGAREVPESLPLYRRALTVLPERGEFQDLEVDLLLCSQRPNAVMQALRILMGRHQWERAAQVAERFCRQSPLLNKEIFTTLLCEVSQHRDVDPYLDLLWALCPEDLSVTSILNIVLKNLPSASQSSSPFPTQSSQLTIGLLRPLLSKVLQRETKAGHRYGDILQSPSFPPPTPPRQTKGLPRAVTDPVIDHQDSGTSERFLTQHT